MKIIVLGDCHGRSFWKYIVNTQQFDKLFFIGDYWDSFDISFDEQQKNFLDIVAYKQANPDKGVRPESLTKNAYQFETLKQVVGHTQQNSITVQKGRYFFIDTLGFSRQYLILEGDEYIIDKI
jgi:predicted phosphodiesterase